MTLEEFSDVIGVNIIITRYANQGGRHTVKLENTEVKDDKRDPGMRGVYGEGKSIREAKANYIIKISDKWLVIDALSSTRERREFGVPELSL